MSETIKNNEAEHTGADQHFSDRVSQYVRMSGEKPRRLDVQDHKLFVTSAVYQVLRPLDDPEDEDIEISDDGPDEIEFKIVAQVNGSNGSKARECRRAIIMRGKDEPNHLEFGSDPINSGRESYAVSLGRAFHRTLDTAYAEEFVEIVDNLAAEGLLKLIPSEPTKTNQ